MQERWKQDDQNKNRVVIVAEHVSYAATAGAANATKAPSAPSASSGSANGENQNSVPDSF